MDPLRGRVAIVTGASRRAGIGYAVARRLAALGADLFLHHYSPHDSAQPYGADDLEAVIAGVRDAQMPGARLEHRSLDLARPSAPAELIDAAATALGRVDILICNQALSGSDGALGTLDAGMLDRHWAVNTRASILLAQEFARRHDGGPGGRVIFLTSGQDLGPMRDEVAYAASKGALASITRTLADHVADAGITLNAVNPGPVDTGYADAALLAAVGQRFPQGRWAKPEDPARLIAWLATDEAGWITGQIINSEGGFRR
jgi:3-oxoacyl-[acyl-carrier protein] reductase